MVSEFEEEPADDDNWGDAWRYEEFIYGLRTFGWIVLILAIMIVVPLLFKTH